MTKKHLENRFKRFLGFMQFGMTLAANYSLLQKKYSRPLGRYRAEKAQVKAAKEDDQARLLNPPSYAPSTRPPPKASTYMPTDNSYLQPNDLGASFGGPSRVRLFFEFYRLKQ